VLDFALELRRAGRGTCPAITEEAPPILGVDRIWVVVRFGDRRHTIASGDGAAAANVDRGRRRLGHVSDRVNDQPVGVLERLDGPAPGLRAR
jgi:hypothetical protein